MKKHIYHHDKVVIGGGLDAATYALSNNLVLIQNHYDSPLIFEKEKLRLWNQTLFSLSLAAKLPVTNEIQLVRIDDGKEILVNTKNNQAIRFTYKELIIFDDENIQGLTLVKNVKSKKKVLDWFDVKSGMSHGVEIIETDSDFVKEIKFYSTERLDGIHLNKNGLLPSGEEILEIIPEIKNFNCCGIITACVSPEIAELTLPKLSILDLPYGFKVNAFKDIPEDARNPYEKQYDGNPTKIFGTRAKEFTPKVFSKFVNEASNLGATLLGGCCEIKPKHIEAIKK